MNNISAWSIRNPVVPIVVFLGLLFMGMFSFGGMGVNDNPDIDFPAATVRISQPGAAPSEIETQITQLVEAAVRNINGVDLISSTAREGSSNTFVQFEIGVDADQGVNDVKNAIDQIRGDLPDGILEPRISRIDVTGNTLAYFAVQATDMTIEQLSWFVDDTVAKRLLSVNGMAAVSRGGGVDREIRVILDPPKMQALGVTASQVNAALRQVNLDAAGGRAEIAGSRQSVRVLGNAKSAYDLGQTQISLGGGKTIKLSSIANISDGFAEQTRIGKIRGKQVVTFAMDRAKGASDVSVYDDSMLVLEQIEKENPGTKFERLFSTIEYTKGQYRSSIAAMVEGALLAVVVVFLFLRDWRATLISAIAIPLSAIPTFWFMDMLGFSLNTMSLLALGLVAGVLVDDAIVEIENIVRHMRMGKSAYQASIDAADEIGLAVVATTFSIVAVFFPVGLMPGISGQFFKNFGFTVVAAVLMSLAVARMISPMIAAYFLRAKGKADHAKGPWMDRYIVMLKWTLDHSRAKAYAAGGGFRRKFASLFLDHRIWLVGVGFLAFALTILLFVITPAQFFPTTNNDFSRVNIEMVPGTTIKQTEAVSGRVAELLEEQQEVQNALERISEGSASIFITLKEDRVRTSIEFERDLAPALSNMADARVSFASQSGGGGTGRDISIMLSGSDPVLLDQTAAQLAEEMKGVKEVRAPRVNADMRRPEIIITPRLDLAAQMGVTTAALSQTIRIATLGDINQNSAKFSLSDRQIPIRVMLPEKSRQELSTLANLPVPTTTGGSVPLSRVADISFGSGPTTIQRQDQKRRVFVGADLAQDVVKGDAMAKINKLPTMENLPQGVSNAPFGQDVWQQEMVKSFITAVIQGVILVFAVLVLLYRRFMSPLVNMSSLMLAPLGGVLFIWASGNALSLPVFIGILMLLGIVGKNSILLIDFALIEIEKGVDKFDAIVEAGRKRAQPIVMTTAAMVAGMIPTAISLSGDGAWRAPMGIVVIGGLIVSTILTLALVPAWFSLASDIEKWMGSMFRKNLITGGKDDDKGGHQPEIQPAE